MNALLTTLCLVMLLFGILTDMFQGGNHRDR